jgi:hypothetical protein
LVATRGQGASDERTAKIHAACSTGYDAMTEVLILAVDDAEREFAMRAFGVPAFTAATPTMKGTHVVVIDGPGAGLRMDAALAVGALTVTRIAFMEPAPTENDNAVSNVHLARLPPEDDAEAPDRRDAA